MNNEKILKNLIIFIIILFFLISIIITLNSVGYIKVNAENINISYSTNINYPISNQTEKININSCSKEALESLPDIGDLLAERIIEGRPYKDIFELDKIKGIGKDTIKSIENYVRCE